MPKIPEIRTNQGDIIGIGVDGNGNIIVKNINIVIEEVTRDYGLNLLPQDYFKTHKSTENDFLNWKNGFSFELASIYEKKALRRNLVDTIRATLERNQRILLLGESGTSKSTILMEIICDYFDKGYRVLFNFGNTDLSNDDSLIEFMEKMADANNKILVAVDNVHDKKVSAIFYIMEMLGSYERNENFLFVLAARLPEFSLLKRDRLAEINNERHRDSLRKSRNHPDFEFVIPPFTVDEVRAFINKYVPVKSSQEIENIINLRSVEIHKNTGGNPILVKFAVLGDGLRNDVENRYITYMRNNSTKLVDPVKIQTSIICSLLDIADVRIDDKLLESMNLKQNALSLRYAILYSHPDGTWSTIHPRWDIEFLSFLFGETVEEDLLEERRSYLSQSITAIFSLGDEKISTSIIRILYDITSVIAHGFDKISIDFINSVLEIPDYLDSNALSHIYSETIALNYFKLKMYDKALENCQKAIGYNKDNSNAWYNQGVVLFNLGRLEEAIKSLCFATQLNPKDANCWYDMGNVHASQEEHLKAMECYDKALELDPKYIDAWRNKGISFFMLGEYMFSIECYDKALELDSKYIDAWRNKGISFFKLGEYRLSIECYDKALELDQKDGSLWYIKSLALNRSGDYDKAKQHYDKALELDPTVVNSQIQLGVH